MNCKEYINTKCLLRINEEFDVCPVEAAKRKYEAEKAAEEVRKKANS